MRLLLLSRYDTLPAPSRYRFYQYLPHVIRHGIDVTVAPLLDNNFVRRQYALRRHPLLPVPRLYARRIIKLLGAKEFDLVWLEKEALPWIPTWIENALGLASVPYVVDYDDAAFVTYNEGRSTVTRTLLGGKIAHLMRGAVLVIAGNRYLAQYARDAGAPWVDIVPSVVELARYPFRSAKTNEVFTVGWIGSPANSRHVGLVAEALATICQDGNAKVQLVGGWHLDLPPEVLVEYSEWSEATEVQQLQGFDVGIMPLEDGPWEQGKCGLKLIQYMAAGLPVVASPVGVNCEIVEHGVTGFLATTTAEWELALGTLRDDPALRRAMGEAGRLRVEREYCLEVTAPRVVGLLKGAFNRSSQSA